MALIAAHLNAKVIIVLTVYSDRYIISRLLVKADVSRFGLTVRR